MAKKQNQKATVIDITDDDSDDAAEGEKGTEDSNAELG